MTSKSPFKKVQTHGKEQIDIEALFKDLKNRSPKIKDLFSHQADILRDYQKFSDASDVSLELPTGSGKTLVGLLIAEWRRKILGERILYLTPTKQLANQVRKLSKEYGIETRVFVGSKKNYDVKEVTAYRSSQVIAISTYSGLFNAKPGLDDPQTIIFDDAHSSETYIGQMWSLSISRKSQPESYSAIIQLFEKELSQNLIGIVNRSIRPNIPLKTEKVPLGAFYTKLSLLREILDSIVAGSQEADLYFPWMAIREGLQACHMYVSLDEILIRPYIPPTLSHKPFAGAIQRIYMSATLGRGGELERITGIREIKRIPKPKTYLSRSIGRRFFVFPTLSKGGREYFDWIAKRLSSVDRTLVLCPNQPEAQKFETISAACTPKLEVLGAKDIEDDLTAFTKSIHSALLLTNRYDGLDLPDGVCRQIILDGLPSRTNLQETFLEERLGLDILLRERIKTRIEQASGRCTRSDTDSAAVIMLGNSLLEFCTRKENQKIFHPEIRAEILFSLDQSKSAEDLDPMLDSFMKRDSDWGAAEQNIAEIRSSESLPDTTVTDILESVVRDEVDFGYAMWTQDYEKALVHGKKVVDGLSGNKVASYRALWSFLVAGAAFLQSQHDKKYEKVITDFISRAKETCKTVSWFPHEMKYITVGQESAEAITDAQALQVEAIVDALNSLGSTGPRFNTKMDEVEMMLKATDPKLFDQGMVELGHLLGFTTWKPAGNAAPDAVWQLTFKMVFVLEGKSDETPNEGISVQNCRQTSGHLDWAKAEPGLKDIKDSFCILVTPKSTIDKEAIAHSEGIYYFAAPDMIKLFNKTKFALMASRAVMTASTSSELREIVLQKLVESSLTPEEIVNVLTSTSVSKLPISK